MGAIQKADRRSDVVESMMRSGTSSISKRGISFLGILDFQLSVLLVVAWGCIYAMIDDGQKLLGSWGCKE